MIKPIALFGEAEKGPLATPLTISSLAQLHTEFGNPPKQSEGLTLAIEVLLEDYSVVYTRVEEEGFSYRDYTKGLEYLKNACYLQPLAAICLPGVSDLDLVNQVKDLCKKRKTVMITTEKDLYDYITFRQG